LVVPLLSPLALLALLPSVPSWVVSRPSPLVLLAPSLSLVVPLLSSLALLALLPPLPSLVAPSSSALALLALVPSLASLPSLPELLGLQLAPRLPLHLRRQLQETAWLLRNDLGGPGHGRHQSPDHWLG
jgi:hypothetical protein